MANQDRLATDEPETVFLRIGTNGLPMQVSAEQLMQSNAVEKHQRLVEVLEEKTQPLPEESASS